MYWQIFVLIAGAYMVGIAMYELLTMDLQNRDNVIVNAVSIGVGASLIVIAVAYLVHSHGKGKQDSGKKFDGNKGQGQGQGQNKPPQTDKIGGKKR